MARLVPAIPVVEALRFATGSPDKPSDDARQQRLPFRRNLVRRSTAGATTPDGRAE
jgi:hypothetical protein